MIGVLTLFGETDLQPVLRRLFARSNMCFIDKNCTTSVQLQMQVEAHKGEFDVVIVNGSAIEMELFSDVVRDIRIHDERIRIILVLNGTPENYVRGKLIEYSTMQVDLIFDNNGFDASTLLERVNQGRLPKKTPKERVIKKIEARREDNEEKIDTSHIPEVRNSYSEPEGQYKIGVINITHGAGATTAVVSIARFFAIQNYKTAVIDYSGDEALKRAKLKNIDILDDFEGISDEYNTIITDFGTPYKIESSGERFSIEKGYNVNNFKHFFDCDIKVVMCLCDAWHILKLDHIMQNDGWTSKIDSSYIFLVPGNADKIKAKYKEINVYDRNSDYKDLLLEEIRRTE